MFRILRLLTALLAVPLLGIAAAIARFWDFSGPGTLTSAMHASVACVADILRAPGADACGSATSFGWLAIVSTAILAISVAIIPLTRLVAIILGAHRSVLSIGFWPYALAVTLIVGLISLVHVGIFAGAASLIAQHWFAVDPTSMLTAFGIVGLGAAYAILRGLGVFFVLPKSYVAARPISFYEYPRLGLMVRDIAKKLNARMPDNVIIGLQPTFFATSAPIHTPYTKSPLKGQTLHLSLPLMQYFTEGELRAVIGHELGHFSGGDTAYSKRFAPIYSGMSKASEVLSGEGRPLTRLLSLPAKMLIDDLIYAFAVVERRIGRSRERRADEAGAKVSSPHDIAYSLLKSTLLGSVWSGQMETFIERGRLGRFSRNLVRNFAESVRLDVDRQRLAPMLQYAMGESVHHPTDSHPPTEDRISAFGLSLAEVCSEDVLLERFFATRKVTDGLDNMTALEEDLTALQYHIYSELWPKGDEGERSVEEIFGYLLTDFLALMVTIDGSVDDREILAAETKAGELFGNLDREAFRERCRNPDDIPSLEKMISFAGRLLTETGISNLKTVLRTIASADGTLHPKEEVLLAEIEKDLVSTPFDEAEAAGSR